MKWGNDDMRKHALKCLGRSYFKAKKTSIENAAERDLEQLENQDNVGWELTGQIVTTRRPRGGSKCKAAQEGSSVNVLSYYVDEVRRHTEDTMSLNRSYLYIGRVYFQGAYVCTFKKDAGKS